MSEIADRSQEAAVPPEDGPQAPDQPVYEPPLDEPKLDEREEDEDDEVPGPREETEEEILVPKVDPVERKLWSTKPDGSNYQERTYIQGPFLWFQQTEMYGLLGRATRIVLEGDSGLNMDELFKIMQPKSLMDDFMSRMPGYEDAPDRAESQVGVDDAARMLGAFSRLIEQTPEILKEAYCIILDIPKAHRNWAMEWALPKMDRETGKDVLHTFIDQNWGVLEGFFTEELPQLLRRAVEARRRHRESSGHRRGR